MDKMNRPCGNNTLEGNKCTQSIIQRIYGKLSFLKSRRSLEDNIKTSHKIKLCGLNLNDSGQVQSSYVWSTVVTVFQKW